MAETDAKARRVREVKSKQLALEAVKTDDVSLMEQAIDLASENDPRNPTQEVLDRALKRSAARGSLGVLRCVLERGANVSKLTASNIIELNPDGDRKPSQAVLEILVDHGWDIDTHSDGSGAGSWPLLWLVTEYPDLVDWCLNHGASVDLPDDAAQRNTQDGEAHSNEEQPTVTGWQARPTLLGAAATQASVETFELLRAKGAPLDPRTLHRAVEQATLCSPKEGENERSPSFDRLMGMVRHLVDVVKIDVNTVAHKIGTQTSTPLCFPASRPTTQDFRELVNFLLDRGADPDLTGFYNGSTETWWPSAMACSEHYGNGRFPGLVRDWKARQKAADGAE